jgi:hypothetical protein
MIIFILHALVSFVMGGISITCFMALSNCHDISERVPVVFVGACCGIISIACLMRFVEILYRRIHDGYWEDSI